MLHTYYPTVPHHYKFELNKDFTFDAAHFIPHEDAGKCQQVHGHTYSCNLTIAGDYLDEAGFLVNFALLKKLVADKFDHRTINDFIDVPSTEKVAEHIYFVVDGYLKSLSDKVECLQVILRETPSSYVRYRPW